MNSAAAHKMNPDDHELYKHTEYAHVFDTKTEKAQIYSKFTSPDRLLT